MNLVFSNNLVNLGNPEEFTIQDFANVIRDKINPNCDIVNLPATMDDPKRRKPDIGRAKEFISWQPKFSVADGIDDTINYFKNHLFDRRP